jgi:hypothetical protein
MVPSSMPSRFHIFDSPSKFEGRRFGCETVGAVGRPEKLNPRLQPSAHSLSVLRSNQRASLTSRSVALLSSKTAHASCTTSGGITNPVGEQNRTLSRATAHSPESRNRGKRREKAIVNWSPEAEVGGSNPSASAKEIGCNPDTWVAFHSEDIGNTLLPNGSSMGSSRQLSSSKYPRS